MGKYLINHDFIMILHNTQKDTFRDSGVAQHVEVLGGSCAHVTQKLHAASSYPCLGLSCIWLFLNCMFLEEIGKCSKVFPCIL